MTVFFLFYLCNSKKICYKDNLGMKLFKYLFSRKSASPKGTVISYGRGPEGEEVIIDITETKHINLKVIITFFVCLPVMMALFQLFMELTV